jgi:hypothetical protein
MAKHTSFFGGSTQPKIDSLSKKQLAIIPPVQMSNMGKFLDITVTNNRKLEDLQADFSACFTFLKIEFFKSPHKIGEGSAKTLIYERNRMVRDCRAKNTEGLLKVSENMLVSELEEKFLKDFGLAVQVFRKSGNVWLETSATHAWTLRQQNDEGAELSKQMKDNDKFDYRDFQDIN